MCLEAVSASSDVKVPHADETSVSAGLKLLSAASDRLRTEAAARSQKAPCSSVPKSSHWVATPSRASPAPFIASTRTPTPEAAAANKPGSARAAGATDFNATAIEATCAEAPRTAVPKLPQRMD